MTKIQKRLLCVGITGTALLLLATVAMNSPGHVDVRMRTPRPTQEAAVRVVPPPVVQASEKNTLSTSFATDPIAPLPANAASIPDEDLLKLSAMIDLASARDRDPDKKRWAQALPIAQMLLQGPCDCEQRNWLNHFVEAGNDALTDATDRFHEHVWLVSNLARNDSQAMAMSHKAH